LKKIKYLQKVLSGFVKKFPYEIKLESIDEENGDSLIFNDSANGENGYFSYSIFIPSKILRDIKNKFKVYISQNGKEVVREFTFGTFKSGVVSSVNDIDLAIKQMKYLITKEEASLFKSKNKTERLNFFNEIWKKYDPTPESDFNELMDEYFRRVDYTNEHFDGWQPGWETDRGMIYILFGAPDQINRYNSTNNISRTRQVWYYQKISKEFSFIDQNGFGDYRLENQFSSNWNF
jgi:GWxTD domain-containing protein